MTFTLIICTYMRPNALLKLLNSVNDQSFRPTEIIIVDGSVDNDTERLIKKESSELITYYRVDEKDRGLTRQRNFGISKVSKEIDYVCFLDDDTVLLPDYFKQLLQSYIDFPDALGVGGYIDNEVVWREKAANEKLSIGYFEYDGWVRKDGGRFILRKRLGLDTNRPPAFLPKFSHGRSVSFLPPSNKVYEVEQFMGGVSSFPKKVLDEQKFSEHFEGYGLYEDADYTFRLSRKGKLYVNTAAKLNHYHESTGRPNLYYYGKMVIRNGWYVWRVRYPKPNFKNRLKWNATAFLLTLVRFTNSITGPDRKRAFQEGIGRCIGWWSLLIDKPKIT